MNDIDGFRYIPIANTTGEVVEVMLPKSLTTVKTGNGLSQSNKI